jgi:predicted permease
MSGTERGRGPEHRLIAWLTRLLPREFRAEYGAQIVEVFGARQAQLGGAAALRNLLREVWSLCALCVREWSGFIRVEGRQMLRADWAHELRLAGRTLQRAPAYSASVVVTLAVGVAGLSALLAVVRASVLSPLPYQEPESLVRLLETPRNAYTGLTTSLPNVLEWQARSRTLTHITAVVPNVPVNVRIGESVTTAVAARISAEGFPMLGVRPLRGAWPAAGVYEQGGPSEIVVTHRFWKDVLAGDTAAVGRPLRVNAADLTIAAVMPEGFTFPTATTDIILPLRITPGVGLASANGRWARLFQAYARIAPAADLAAADAELRGISAQLEKEFGPPNQGMAAWPSPLRQSMLGDARTLMIILLVGALLVLLVASSNVAALTLVRRNARASEFAIRIVHGAGPGAIARTVLAEFLLLIGAAAAFAAYLTTLLGPFATRLIPATLPAAAVTSWQNIVLSVAIAFATGLLLFLATLRTTTGTQLLLSSGTRSTGGRAQRMTRSALVVAQIAAACALLLAGGALLRSYLRVVRVPTGFTATDVLTLDLRPRGQRYANPSVLLQFYDQLLEALRQLPGVSAATLTDAAPLTAGGTGWTFVPEGRKVEAGHEPAATVYTVGDDYARVLRIPLLRGRALQARDTFALSEGVHVSATLARSTFGTLDVIGRRIALGSVGSTNPAFTIVGVVGDIRDRDLATAPTALILRRSAAATLVQSMTVLVRTAGDPLSIASAATRLARALDSELPPVAVQPLQALVHQSATRARLAAGLIASFGALAFVLACVGIIGLFAQVAAEERQASAIRLALGATPASIVAGMLRAALVMTSIGVACGIALAFAASGVTGHYMFGVSPLDFRSTVIAAVLLTLAGAAAAVLAARRNVSVRL